ncbi:ABC-F family ATP-binding cassette domain-containing protein [Actinomycetospora atypica]|uniref:ABC-F family ATP-binding cassette domain-containing protein n=1 Tax=Actinomycetospora atypica TaxID=1290095 RepID=A0ABV9YVK0_9PSEU
MSSSVLHGLEPVVAHGLVRTFGTRRVLDGLDLTVAPGTRLGLIGENGTGKSTLLRLLAGRDRPDEGAVQVPRDLVYLPQEPEVAAHSTVGDMLDDALRPLHDAVASLGTLAQRLAAGHDVAADYDAALSWAIAHDAWDADRRAEVTAGTLGVADLDRARPVDRLSGGQRTRLALAAALVRRPAVLLLDEPTNHLDDEALDLLERSLLELPGVVVAASHDRTFLDRVATELVDLDAGALGTDGRGGRRFGGSFGEYLAAQADSRRRWEETFAAQQEEIAALREKTHLGLGAVAAGRGPTDNDKFVHKFKGANVERARARRVHDAERRLEVAERGALPKPPAPLRFSGSLTGAGSSVSVRGLRVAGRLRLDRLEVGVGEKLLVTGANGTGKSTLLDVLAGRLVPDEGTVQVAARTVALVSQDPEFDRPDLSARATYAGAVGAETAEAVPLGSLGLLHPRDHGTAVGALSVGQRRRLSIAVAVAAGPDLLLLDEPTNHVSLRLAGELEEALGSAPGTVVVTSHDRWLRSRWSGPSSTLTVGGSV